jgi:DNA-directed RNA polymerase specialized sigma24 family protein
MATTTTDLFLELHDTKPATSRTKWDTFDDWFSRCHNALHFIACRILADSAMAASAVRNCHLKASRNLPTFETEGAFRSWALRLLISEALSILHQRP